MFSDETFETPFEDGQTVDIGADSIESQIIYVQAEANISNPNNEYAIHLKYCRVQELTMNETSGNFTVVSDQFDFLVDGCMSTLGFVEKNFGKIK